MAGMDEITVELLWWMEESSEWLGCVLLTMGGPEVYACAK